MNPYLRRGSGAKTTEVTAKIGNIGNTKAGFLSRGAAARGGGGGHHGGPRGKTPTITALAISCPTSVNARPRLERKFIELSLNDDVVGASTDVRKIFQMWVKCSRKGNEFENICYGWNPLEFDRVS